MGRRRHKRKNSHVVIVTSEATDAGAKLRQFRIRPWSIQFFVLLLSVVIGVLIGYFLFQREVIESDDFNTAIQEEDIADLQAENADLMSQIAELNSTIQILSETVTQKTESESILSEALSVQTVPVEFPLTGFSTMETVEEGDPMCIFSASSGAMVVASASGTVSAVNDDGEYGHNVWVDHGNGYITIYRNQGEVKVKQGEKVNQGNTLFLIDGDSSKLGYQMMKDGAYIDPMDMLAIDG